MSLCAQALLAAQGSTPEQGPQHNAAASKQTAHSASATARNGMPAPNVYAQGPYTEKELVRFIESMPHFLAWARNADTMQAHPATNAAGRPDFAYTPQAAAKTRELGWEPRRFFCLLGRTAAALYLVGEGTDLVHALPPDMPTVTEAEMALVRKHLASLLHAGAGGPPPALAR
jgi:hypothetical protein